MPIDRVWAAAVLMAVLCCAGAACAGLAASEDGPIRVERFTHDFTNALALARAESRPLITVIRNEGCPFCDRMETVLKGSLFNRWVRDSGIYLAEAMINETNSSPVQLQAVRFVTEGMRPEAGGFSFPLIGVYWPRGSNEAVRTAFVGRRAMMPSEDKENRSLAVQLVSALDSLVGEYTGKLPGRQPCKELLANWDKRVEVVKVAAEGPGTVSTTPENGVMVGMGSLVRIHARPEKGMKLLEWRGPNGIKVSRAQNQKVYYEMGGGTYTAVFVPRTQKKTKKAGEE